MTTLVNLLRDTIRAFGDYLWIHPNARYFPDELIAEHRQKYYAFWNSYFADHMSIWKEQCLKGVFVGTIVGRDLTLYVRRFSNIFDRLLLREPLSKLFFLAPYKTQSGFFEEAVAYMNVIIEIERWLEHDIVCLYPPFFLMPDEIRKNILDLFENCYFDNQFGELALSCPDRKLSKSALLQRYEETFGQVFLPQYIDYYGGIHLFTREYIIRTIAQDLITAVVLASEVDAIVVSSLQRTTRLLEWGHLGPEREPAHFVPSPGLGCNRETANDGNGGCSDLRRFLQYISYNKRYHASTGSIEPKTLQQKIECEGETALLHRFAFLTNDLAICYLKVPFKTTTDY